MKQQIKITKDHITDSIAVGLRKGIFSAEGSKLYDALNPLFFNDDSNIQAIAHEYITALADAAMTVINLENQDNNKFAYKKIAQAMKMAACKERFPDIEKSENITPKNQGFDCFKSMLPLNFNNYGQWQIQNDEGKIRTMFWSDEKQEWQYGNFVHPESIEIAGMILLELIKNHESVKEQFEPYLKSKLPQLYKALFQASLEMQDDDWEALIKWILG